MLQTPIETAAVRRPSLAVLVAMAAIGPLSLNIFMPSMPGMVAVFDTTPARVQLALSLFLAATGLAQLVIGPLSDHYGRRPVLLAGMALFVAASIACRFAPSIEALIAARLLQGAGGVSGLVLARSVIRDLYGREKSASMIGYVTMGMAVAPMVAPAIGGWLDGVAGWQASFDLLIVAGALVMAAAFFDLNETNRNPTPSFGLAASLGSYRALARIPAFWAFALTSAFASCVFFAFLGGAPFVVTEIMHLTPTVYGFYFFLVAGGYIVGNFLSGRLAERLGIFAMITTGNALSVAAVGLMAGGLLIGILHPLVLFLPMFVSSLANGVTLPSAMAGSVSVSPELAGAAAGLSGSMQMGAGALASATVGTLIASASFGGTAWPLVLVMGVCAVLALFAGLACLAVRERVAV